MNKWTLIFENRLPVYVPFYRLYSNFVRTQMRRCALPDCIFVALTFDIENSWGDEEQSCQKENNYFLRRIGEVNYGGMTFFVTGNLVLKLSDCLKDLPDGNEIGMHGYRHELWRSAYFVEKRAIKNKVKPRLIERSLQEFKNSGLARPTSFRAPYMYCKQSDMKLVERASFTVDSSDPSFKGMHPIRQFGNITRIPVTAHPIPYFESCKGFAFTKFHLFNLKTLNEFHDQNFLEFIGQILKWQVYKRQIPHLVFLAHPWEFFTNSADEFDENFTHRGPHNYEILKDRLALIKNNFNVRYVTLNQLSCLYKENR